MKSINKEIFFENFFIGLPTTYDKFRDEQLL
jgi:hypothetical protein